MAAVQAITMLFECSTILHGKSSVTCFLFFSLSWLYKKERLCHKNHFFLLRRFRPQTDTGGSGVEKGLAFSKKRERRLSNLTFNM